uniref:FAD-binding domain-containing protein n=1 Tax=Bionectria ochroleuca TaxID=29856 RepID=A0A0B7KST7_BIOOC
MRSLALAASPITPLNPDEPFVAEYRLLWCSLPKHPAVAAGHSVESHGKDASSQFMSSKDRSWLFVYERLPKATKSRASYSKADAEVFAQRLAELFIAPDTKLRDVFSSRYTAGMANVEEGMLKHWSWDRIVLVGDAVHKLTPNSGQGYNSGLQDIVVLVNELHKALSSSDGGCLSQDTLAAVFSRYQTLRFKITTDDCKNSNTIIRMSCWQNWIFWLMDRFILPYLPIIVTLRVNTSIAGTIKNAHVVDFVDGDEPFEGKVPWTHRMPRPSQKREFG